MHNSKNNLAICLSILVLNSCAHAMDKTLSPPSDNQWINVEVKNPSRYTKPFPLEVTYISHKCLKDRTSGFDGASVIEPGYNGIKIPLQQQGNSDVWSARVALNGGGSCSWTLSEFNVGIEYIDATHLRKDLVPGNAAGVTIAFDNDASRNGQFTFVKGDVNLTPQYYPYIREKRLGGVANTLSFLGEKDFLSIRTEGANNVIFSPKLDERKVVRFIGVEKKVKGVYPKIIYPDGSLAPEKTLLPDFDTVDKME
ncbi:hypothetical protein [Atlantibacter hermannii]|uniref:hypothetical protein n=1 Tax=Atlantibacter hermannii TaxID=565 RepID=UPI0022B7D187|nr:hypothetical protein [Atlantibacter hermannii]MCZ7837068.1 hypothetical protein [Atlantibacter hermannii]